MTDGKDLCMKRIGTLIATVALFVMGTALPALARYAPPPPNPGGSHGGSAGDRTPALDRALSEPRYV